MEHTLEDLATAGRHAGERSNALSEALEYQARIWGEALLLDKALKVLSENQKARVFAEVLAVTSRRSKSETASPAARLKDVVELIIAHGGNSPKVGA